MMNIKYIWISDFENRMDNTNRNMNEINASDFV